MLLHSANDLMLHLNCLKFPKVSIQGCSQVLNGGGHINLSKTFSAKIDKTSLYFKNFQKDLKGFKVNFQTCSN